MGETWSVTDDEYLNAVGASILPYHDAYPQGKQGGIELVHHGERVAACGELVVRAEESGRPGHARLRKRSIDRDKGEITLRLGYPELDLPHLIRLRPEGEAVRLSLSLERPLPEPVRAAWFRVAFFPPAYWGKTFHTADGSSGVIPRDSGRPMAEGEGGARPEPMARSARLVLAPEDPARKLTIEAADGELELVDRRPLHTEAWINVRAEVPPDADGKVVEWLITPNLIPDWRRRPVICISQVGYHPDQVKQAVIELDARWDQELEARLLQVTAEEGRREVAAATPEHWGRFLRYEYAVFDFTEIREPGVYLVEYGDQEAGPFRIAEDVYEEGVWQPTLDSFFPVQMCHASVWDGGRLWHAACHLDDALQAPTDHEHFDGYRQGESTDTPFEPYEHIPHVDLGGWHDAGDTDLAAGSQARTVHALAMARREFGADWDRTSVQPEERMVRMHRPDGLPDIVQQIAWGARCLLGGYRAVGHSFCGIIAGDVKPYHQRGEVSTMTDNLLYDPSLEEDQRTGTHAGKRDDRWAFTNRDTALEYQVAAALAAAAPTLKGYDDELSAECRETAEAAWEFEQQNPPAEHRAAYVPRGRETMEVTATSELLLLTGGDRYAQRLRELLPAIKENFRRGGWAAARALPHLEDKGFEGELRQAAAEYARHLGEVLAENPFRVLYRPRIWGIAWRIEYFAVQHYFLCRAFPDLFDREQLLAVVNYVLGCHPDNNLSLVSGVGASSITTCFGINRASWHYEPGGVVSGPTLIRPDFPELKRGFPFFWQQSEYVMPGAGAWVFCVLAAEDLLKAEA